MRKPCGPAHVLGHELRVEGAEPVGRPLLAGQHCVNAGHLLRRSFVDGTDARMGMRRKHKDRVRLASEIDVGDIPPLPGQEPAVFLAGNRLSDAKAHAALSFRWQAESLLQAVATSSRMTYNPTGLVSAPVRAADKIVDEQYFHSCSGHGSIPMAIEGSIRTRYQRVSNPSTLHVNSAAFIGAFAKAHVNGRLCRRMSPNLLAYDLTNDAFTFDQSLI